MRIDAREDVRLPGLSEDFTAAADRAHPSVVCAAASLHSEGENSGLTPPLYCGKLLGIKRDDREEVGRAEVFRELPEGARRQRKPGPNTSRERRTERRFSPA